MNISAVIITFNEERNIARCLSSLKDIADEIIIVDSFSTDNTREICLQSGLNVHFFEHEWIGYSAQKNYANSLATNDLIFSIDADEAVSDELCNSILQCLQCKNQEIVENNCFSMNRLTNYCGKWIYHCGWYPDTKIRIFNRKHFKWEGLVHEQLIADIPINVKLLHGDLLHYTFYTLEEHIDQTNKFSTLAARQAYERGKQVTRVGIRFHTWWKFFEEFFLKCGFMDGHAGYVICKISSYTTYLRYEKLYHLLNNSHEEGEKRNRIHY